MARAANTEIATAQAEIAPPVSSFDCVIERVVERTLARLESSPLPVRALAVRTETAAKLLGIDVETLVQDRRSDAQRVPFVRYGRRVLYRLKDLDAVLDSLPRFGGAR